MNTRAFAPVQRQPPALRPLAAAQSPAGLDGARLFQDFCFYTPLLWLLGVLTLCGAALVVRLAIARWPRGLAINLVVGSWLLIGAVQAVTSILHSVAVGNVTGELGNLGGLPVLGWVFGGLIIAFGSGQALATPRTIRAAAWLGLCMLILALSAVPMRLLGIPQPGFQMTPLGMLLPASNFGHFYCSALIFMHESTFGEDTARLVLFFPWYTALGLGAISVVFISALDHDWKWRVAGMLGGTVATVFSWSRIAIFCLVFAGGLILFMRLPRIWRILAIGVAVAALCVALMAGFDPLGEAGRAQSAVDTMRQGSNMARDTIYGESWEGFVHSPLFGNGLNFPLVHGLPSAVGSHSTIYGLLYTAGAPGLAAFLLALLVTAIALWLRYLAAPPRSMEQNAASIGLGLVLCLALYCKFEALYSLTVPCILLFAWIGACFPSPDTTMAVAPSVKTQPLPTALQPASAGTGRAFQKPGRGQQANPQG